MEKIKVSTYGDHIFSHSIMEGKSLFWLAGKLKETFKISYAFVSMNAWPSEVINSF